MSKQRSESPESHALRVILRTISTATPLWEGLFIDGAKVEAAKLEARLVDESGKQTALGRRYMPKGEGATTKESP